MYANGTEEHDESIPRPSDQPVLCIDAKGTSEQEDIASEGQPGQDDNQVMLYVLDANLDFDLLPSEYGGESDTEKDEQATPVRTPRFVKKFC